MSEPSSFFSVDTCQVATSVPSGRRSTIGESAGLTSQFVPEATVVGWLQPPDCFSANFKVIESPLCSTQLRRTPFSETVHRGPLLCDAGGACRESTRTGHAAEAGFACGVAAEAATVGRCVTARPRAAIE